VTSELSGVSDLGVASCLERVITGDSLTRYCAGGCLTVVSRSCNHGAQKLL
jgi:hypothetical protein